MNRIKAAHEIALKLLNVTMYKEFSGFQYNFHSRTVDEKRDALFIPNLSYKIEF